MVIYVYTDWCPYCREFERDLLDTRAVEAYLRDEVVKVRVNPETSAGARALANELGVEGYPTVLVMTPGGRPDRMGLRVNGRLRPPSDFIADIDGRMKGQSARWWTKASRCSSKASRAGDGRAGRRHPPAAPTTPLLQRHRADARRAERWDEVVACWTSFLGRNPSHAQAYLARANALAAAGRPAWAGPTSRGPASSEKQRAARRARLDRHLG